METRHCLFAVQIGLHGGRRIRYIDKGNILRALTGLIMGNLDTAQRTASVEIDNRTLWGR